MTSLSLFLSFPSVSYCLLCFPLKHSLIAVTPRTDRSDSPHTLTLHQCLVLFLLVHIRGCMCVDLWMQFGRGGLQVESCGRGCGCQGAGINEGTPATVYLPRAHAYTAAGLSSEALTLTFVPPAISRMKWFASRAVRKSLRFALPSETSLPLFSGGVRMVCGGAEMMVCESWVCEGRKKG